MCKSAVAAGVSKRRSLTLELTPLLSWAVQTNDFMGEFHHSPVVSGLELGRKEISCQERDSIQSNNLKSN